MVSRSDEIRKILCAELDAAKKRNASAVAAFRTVMSEVPSGIPAPDGAFRLQIAGTEHRAALAALYRALIRSNEFIVRGIIPDDLKNL